MLIQLTEEQKMLRDVAREFAQNEIAPKDKWMDENGFDWELAAKLNEAGFMGLGLPEEFGGSNAKTVETVLVALEFAKASASIATFMNAHWMASGLVNVYGTEEQRKTYLPQASSGKIFAFGLSEACAGSDAAGIQSVAVETEDGWVLNGSKAWITNSGIADYYALLVLTDPERGTAGTSVFIVPKDAEGLAIGKFENKMGVRGSATCELALNNVHLPKEALLGERNKGFKMIMQTLDVGRIGCAAVCSGICEHAIEAAKDYANERTAFGKPIKAFQGVAFRFADMYADIKSMELLAFEAATARDAGQRCTTEAAAAKLFATERGLQVCLKAQAVFGGNGMSREYDVERLVRDIRTYSVMDGTPEILRMIVSGAVLKK